MPNAVLFGCAGPNLAPQERAFFRDADPLGFILFARNVETPAQVRRLTTELREAVGRADAPVLIDQEGGRVQRLKPPTWRQAPPAARFADLAARDLAAARQAVYLNHRLLAADLAELGITVDCAPVLDLQLPGAHVVIGDRAFGGDPLLVADLGRAACEGLVAGGVQPIVKHIPGHGRTLVDSHLELPCCSLDEATLAASDFLPFRLLRDQPWAMTAHVLYTAIDPERPATTSPLVIERVIRGHIGFDGLLVSDDLSMQALSGGLDERAGASLAAGCDLALHCNGDAAEMRAVAGIVGPLTVAAQARLTRAQACAAVSGPADVAELAARLDRLLAAA